MTNCSLRSYMKVGLLIALVSVGGCGGKEERIAKHLERAQDYFTTGDLEKARVEFKNVLQMDTKNVEALYGQAQVHERLEKWREAAGLYQRVLELDAAQKRAKERLARLFFIGGAQEEALKLADEILSEDADSVTALTVKGGALAQKGDLDAASELVTKALAKSPGDLDASMLLSSLFAQKKNFTDALRVLEEALKVHPGDAAVLTVMAQINTDAGDEDKAVGLFQQLVNTQPKNLAYRRQLAAYYSRLEKNDAAESVLRDGVMQIPDENEPKLMLTDFLLKTQGAQKALDELRGFIAKEKDSTELRLALARLLEVAGKKDEAKSELTTLVNGHGVEPDALRARLMLAKLAMGDGDSAEAQRLVEEVLKENPRDNDGLLFRAKLALVKKDLPGAIGDLRAVLRDQPTSVEVLTLLGSAHLANQETELAKEQFDKAIAVSANPAPLRFEVGQLYLQAGHMDEALPQLEAVSREPGASAVVFEALLRAQLLNKDINAARATATRVQELLPQQGFGDFLAGQVDVAEGEHAKAVQRFKAALKKTPGAVDALSALVKSRLALKQDKAAIADVEAVLKAEPKHFAAHNMLGELYLVQKKTREAMDEFRTALELNPAIATFHRNLAVAYLQMGDRDGAVKVLREGLDKSSQSESLVVDLASLHERAGKVDEAIHVYNDALEKSPEAAALKNNLAMLLATHKQDAPSLERAAKLIEALHGTENPAYLDTIGWVHYQRGELDQALPPLQQAAAAAPGQPVVQYHLGMVQYKKGDTAGAKQNLENALAPNIHFTGRDEANSVLKKITVGG